MSNRRREHRSLRACRCTLMVAGLALLALAAAPPAPARAAREAPRCEPAGPLVALPELNEASGLAVSRSVPGRLWTHNDSGQPIVFALDTQGKVTARVRLTGAVVEDWEAIAVGPCPAGSCLYIADIGDNQAARKRITIYRTPEPAGAGSSAPAAEALHATYPDGAHDAETLLVTPDGELFIVTKGDPGSGTLYKFPRELKPGTMHQLERVGDPRPAGKRGRSENITDGAVSANGTWVALRTGQRVTFYRSADLLKGNWREAGVVDLQPLREAQGEAIAFGPDESLYLAGEGGGKARPGSFARLTCALN